MSWKRWFKCNTIRYFALDVKCRDNHKNWYTRCLDNNTNINDPSQSSISSCTIGSRWNYSTNSRMGKKFVRYSENDNGIHTWKSYAGGRAQFFIAQVRTHYRHLNNEVYTPLTTLNTEYSREGLVSPLWKRHLGIGGRIPTNFLNDVAIRHLSEDNPQLLTEVRNYRLLYDQYKTKLKSLQRTIDCIIKNRFIERGVYPTASNNFHGLGCYIGEVNSLLELVWVDFVTHINNVDVYHRSNNIANRTFVHNGNLLALDGFLIGRGDEQQIRDMETIMRNIPEIRVILDAFRDLRNSRDDLNNRAQLIRDLSQPFSNAIRHNEYQTLCSCCPTQNATIWDFG